MSFLKDLKTGQEGENKVVETFLEFGLILEKSQKGIKYDLECLAPPFTVEVKNDLYAKKSGNIAIEFFNTKSQKASGIMASESDFWVHIAFDRLLIVKTPILKDFVDKIEPHRIIENGGDGNASLLLYKFCDIQDIFKDLTEENFNILIGTK